VAVLASELRKWRVPAGMAPSFALVDHRRIARMPAHSSGQCGCSPVPTPRQILTDQLSAATERPPLRGHRQHELLADFLDAAHHHLRYRADGLGPVAVPTETTERLGVRPPSGYCQDTQLALP
jgi:hypothetical protein